MCDYLVGAQKYGNTVNYWLYHKNYCRNIHFFTELRILVFNLPFGGDASVSYGEIFSAYIIIESLI